MAISPSLWYGNYKGAVYPIDFHAEPAVFGDKIQHVKTLMELAAEKIVQDSGMTMAALNIIPKSLCELLMKEALLKNRELAVRCILPWWPGRALVLRKLVPGLFRSVEALTSSQQLGDVVRQGLRYTTTLAHTFLDTLKDKAPASSLSRLTFLDLTGFPTAEVIVYFLATHCMLAHNEVRHEAIRSLYDQAVQQAGNREEQPGVQPMDTMEPMEPMEHSLPQDCSVTVKLDAFITSESTHSELCKALKVSSFHNRKLSILIGRLALTCLGRARVSLLLRQVQPQYLTGLQLQYNALTAVDFERLAPDLQGLVNLESLDLACNSIFFHQHQAAVTAAAQVFQAMPRLHRLDLSNNRIKTRLRRLLEGLSRPLTFLRLAGCSLTVTDLVYLSHSPHAASLVELDLSENNLAFCDRQLGEVLTASRSSLCVLELEDCGLGDNNVHALCPVLARMSALMFANFAQNRLGRREGLVRLHGALCEVPTLQVLKVSYPVDCYMGEEGQEDARRAATVAQLDQMSRNSGAHELRTRPLSLVLSELDQVLGSVE